MFTLGLIWEFENSFTLHSLLTLDSPNLNQENVGELVRRFNMSISGLTYAL